MIDWGEIYVNLMTAFGWTWEYIDDNMTLPRYYEISRQWEKWPPMHLAVLAYMGYTEKPSEDSVSKKDGNEISVGDLQQIFGGVSGNLKVNR